VLHTNAQGRKASKPLPLRQFISGDPGASVYYSAPFLRSRHLTLNPLSRALLLDQIHLATHPSSPANVSARAPIGGWRSCRDCGSGSRIRRSAWPWMTSSVSRMLGSSFTGFTQTTAVRLVRAPHALALELGRPSARISMSLRALASSACPTLESPSSSTPL
jgi:hypothetical protein